MADEIFSTLMLVIATLVVIIIFYFLSKIPGAGLVLKIIRGIFIILWSIVLFLLVFFMFFMVGYMVIVFFTFTANPEGILFQGEPINFLIGDNARHAAYFIMVYAGFCLVMVYVLSFIFVFGKKLTKTFGKFQNEITLLVMLVLVFTIFPTVVEAILPDFEVGKHGRYALGFLPLAMYAQGRIKKAKERHKDGRYLSRTDQFYLDMDKEDAKK